MKPGNSFDSNLVLFIMKKKHKKMDVPHDRSRLQKGPSFGRFFLNLRGYFWHGRSWGLLGGSQMPPGYHFGLVLAPFLKDFLYFSIPCFPLLACPRRRQARQILCQKIGDSCLPPGHASPKIGGTCPPLSANSLPNNRR